MFRLSMRNIGDHKGRFVMTALAVILGVSFVVSSFVLSDTIRQTFRTLFADANQNVDLVVRTEGGFDTGPGGIERAPLPAQAVDLVKQVPGVAEAEGPVQSIIPALLDPKGKQVPNNGPPTLGFSWGQSEKLNPLHVAEGRRPGPNEVAARPGDLQGLRLQDRVRHQGAARIGRGQLQARRRRSSSATATASAARTCWRSTRPPRTAC